MDDQSKGTLPFNSAGQPKHEASYQPEPVDDPVSAEPRVDVSAPSINKAPSAQKQDRVLSPNEKTLAMVGGLMNKKMAALQNFLGSQENALRFMSAVMKCIETTPGLLECKPDSLLGAFMEAAGLGFYPGNTSGDCYILPYRSKNGMVAQFQMGYRGLKTLAYRSGLLRAGAELVYENDEFREELGTLQRLTHTRAQGDRGQPIGAYAWAEVSPGKVVFQYMTTDQIMKIKALSQSKNSPYSPWNSSQDPEKWMWKKTAWKQLAKMIPTSDKLDRAIYLDSVSERGGYIQDEATVIEVPFEPSREDKIDAGKERKASLRKKNVVASPDHE